jgi:pyroglutamyl-peptidase
MRMRTILITGFGPFPGAPVNPTAALVRRLARRRWPPGLRVTTHVFRTGYDAVDTDLPRLIARHEPDALLMFGLASRARTLRIETLARNSLGRLPDVSGHVPPARAIVPRGPKTRALPTPAQALLAAARAADVPVRLSRNAGTYLCNYLCWRAAEIAGSNGPATVAFVHVPDTAAIDLAAQGRAGQRMVLALASGVQPLSRSWLPWFGPK